MRRADAGPGADDLDQHLRPLGPRLNVLFEDNHLLVVVKPSGQSVQPDDDRGDSLLDHAKLYIKARYGKPGEVFLGLVHRLDKPVSGVLVLARTSKAAARLAEQFRLHSVRKIYWALVAGHPPDQAEWTDSLERVGRSSHVSTGGKPSTLRFRCLGRFARGSLVEIELATGRHHQIRVQFAHHGHPLWGDQRYGGPSAANLALHARELEFAHPVSKAPMRFVSEPTGAWPGWLAGMESPAQS